MARTRDPYREAEVKEEVKQLLRQMLDGQLDIVSGCMELAGYHSQGYEFVPISFVGDSSMIDHVPRPAQYHLWNQDALREVLGEADPYREQVLEEARGLLEVLADSR